MEYYTYVIQSIKDDRFYYGQTKNLYQRVEDHNLGKSKYTKNYLPWKMFAYKSCCSRAEAMKYERMLKNLHSSEKVLAFLLRHNFIIVDH